MIGGVGLGEFMSSNCTDGVEKGCEPHLIP